jgi:hypothetical protein
LTEEVGSIQSAVYSKTMSRRKAALLYTFWWLSLLLTSYCLLFLLLLASKDFLEKVRGSGHGVLADLLFFFSHHEKEPVQGLVGHVLIQVKREGPGKGYLVSH